MSLRALLRAAALRVPPIATLKASFDQAVTERDAAAAQRDALQAERDALRRERGTLADERAQLHAQLRDHDRFVPPGHFYSPIPSPDDIERAFADQAPPPRTLPGIDLCEDEQLALLAHFEAIAPTIPFAAQTQPGLRFRYENGAYSYADAIALHGMLRHFRPRRVIEIGSGHSSCVTLDTVERFGIDAEPVFIEPYPDLLHSLLRPGDADRIRIVPKPLQDVDLALFDTLAANDILLVDSTHVGKIGSDVNRIFADILPRLRPGVAVHFHDIFYPFEYPQYWLEAGRAWNEAYMLRCFLQYNTRFRVLFWNHYLSLFHADRLERTMPLFMRNTGAALWLRVE